MLCSFYGVVIRILRALPAPARALAPPLDPGGSVALHRGDAVVTVLLILILL